MREVRMSQVRQSRRAGLAVGGFTLIEILVVVVILGIAAAIVVPAIGSRSDLKATSAARMLMADLIYAQNRAISQQKPHFVRFNAGAETYEIFDQMTPSLNYIKHPVEASNFIVTLGPSGAKPIRDVFIDTASFDGKTVLMFDELGTPFAYDTGTNSGTAMTAGSIRLICGTVAVTIIVEPFSGELRLQ
jgi:prepilin-type N-terminal cleavage/methylation domain-containing protein